MEEVQQIIAQVAGEHEVKAEEPEVIQLPKPKRSYKKREKAEPTENVEFIAKKDEPTKPTNNHRIKAFFDKLVDSGSLWFAVVIDLILNGIGFWIIGPEPIMKVGMVCVSFIVVLFSVRAWIKRDKLLWLMFALVASFMDTSFTLLATDVQSGIVGEDKDLTTLKGSLKSAQDYLEALQRKQLEKGAGYAQQIQDARSARDKAKSDLDSYESRSKDTSGHMSASKVFTAIPDAVLSGKWDRWIALSVFVAVFLGLQLTIISATGVKWNESTQSQS